MSAPASSTSHDHDPKGHHLPLQALTDEERLMKETGNIQFIYYGDYEMYQLLVGFCCIYGQHWT